MKKTVDIKVTLLKSNSPFVDFQILGRKLNEYAPLALGCYAGETQENTPYSAVLYDDMPLITAEILQKVAAVMEKKGFVKVALGKGSMSKSGTAAEYKADARLNFFDFLSVNDTSTLVIVYNELRKRIIERNVAAGAVVFGDGVVIDDTAEVAAGAVIEGASEILGDSCVAGGARIKSSRIEDSKICENATVGPFSYIRMHSVIGEGVRIGDFVEVKNSALGKGVKCAHLSYIGDAEVGDNTNVGCGTVFCNYDGKNKHRTAVGKGVFIGANTNLVAPLSVGDGAFIAAGTTVTEDLPTDTFCIGRVKQNVRPKRK